MTEEDEEFMLDNFVTFFIAGESAFLCPWLCNVPNQPYRCSFISFVLQIGQETTANQLAFCVMALANNPDILEK